MLSIPTFVHSTMRRSLLGALATDPTIPEPRRRARRPAPARRTREQGRPVRTPATAPQR